MFTLTVVSEMVIETNRPSTRKQDLYVRWGVIFADEKRKYFINDRSKVSPNGKTRVVVWCKTRIRNDDTSLRALTSHSLSKSAPSETRSNSSKDPNSNRSSYNPTEQYLQRLYFKNVYKPDELVTLGVLTRLEMRARALESEISLHYKIAATMRGRKVKAKSILDQAESLIVKNHTISDQS